MKKKTESIQDFLNRGGKIKKVPKKKGSAGLSKKKKRKIKALKAESKKQLLKDTSSRLNENLPQSEIWFQQLFKSHFATNQDKYNYVFKNMYIPDVINFNKKYVIEIDGSIHNLHSVKQHDHKKNVYYTLKGFRVFRVKAYDLNSYINFCKEYIDYCKLTKLNKNILDFLALTSHNVNQGAE